VRMAGIRGEMFNGARVRLAREKAVPNVVPAKKPVIPDGSYFPDVPFAIVFFAGSIQNLRP
jgi:hypothetical protein